MRADARCTILRADVIKHSPKGSFDLVFLDPPYGKQLGEAALPLWRTAMAEGALIVWEERSPPAIPQGFDLQDQRRYGDTVVTILRKA
jgi:16S rRNA (guanine966-N2)-methyltransferase